MSGLFQQRLQRAGVTEGTLALSPSGCVTIPLSAPPSRALPPLANACRARLPVVSARHHAQGRKGPRRRCWINELSARSRTKTPTE